MMENSFVNSAFPSLLSSPQTTSPTEVAQWENWLASLTPKVAAKFRALQHKRHQQAA